MSQMTFMNVNVKLGKGRVAEIKLSSSDDVCRVKDVALRAFDRTCTSTSGSSSFRVLYKGRRMADHSLVGDFARNGDTLQLVPELVGGMGLCDEPLSLATDSYSVFDQLLDNAYNVCSALTDMPSVPDLSAANHGLDLQLDHIVVPDSFDSIFDISQLCEWKGDLLHLSDSSNNIKSISAPVKHSSATMKLEPAPSSPVSPFSTLSSCSSSPRSVSSCSSSCDLSDRKSRVARYLEKRNKRRPPGVRPQRPIYQSRRDLAARKPRIHGRFAKSSPDENKSVRRPPPQRMSRKAYVL
eukprot:GILJ01001212.1.p1 GENE.GILJ01001212.1~~GILJ01001212.1.p1  ORF type:complete len:296 (-),score=35.84 GILJ01001212.1:165-1052(-)